MRRRATYQDILDLPEHLTGEIIEGELIVSPRPASRHTYTTSVLGGDLVSRFGGEPDGPDAPGGWWILDEPELHLGEDVLVPDLAGWRRDRMPDFPDVPYFSVAPQWLCEAISPSSGRVDRTRKMPSYARHGVGHVWLVDPTPRTLEVSRLESGRWVVASSHGGDEKIRAEPFATVELDMARWWAPVTPSR